MERKYGCSCLVHLLWRHKFGWDLIDTVYAYITVHKYLLAVFIMYPCNLRTKGSYEKWGWKTCLKGKLTGRK